MVSDDGTTLTSAGATRSNLYIKAVNNTYYSQLAFTNGTNGLYGGLSYNNSGQYMQFETNTSEWMRLSSDGKLGIGTTTPVARLNVYGTSGNPSTTADTNNLFSITGSLGPQLNIGGYNGASYGMWLQVKDAGNGGTLYPILLQPLGGNVGIGTSSPQNILHIQGSGTTYLHIGNSTTGSGSSDGADIGYFTGQTALNIVQRENDAMIFSTNDTERMRITSAGSVGIGDTASSNNYRLVIGTPDSGTSNFGIGIFNSGGSTLLRVRNDGAFFTGNAGTSPYNYSTSGRNAVIESSGVLGYLSSTRESKANIESIKSVDFINQLNPVQFNYRKKDSETNEYTDELYDNTNYGFIADEVEKVNKDLVFYKSDGTTLAGVEYNNMIAILTKAIQEMNTKLDEQNQTIQNLQEQINILAK
jgi:chaperonin cofactor prefoldin